MNVRLPQAPQARRILLAALVCWIATQATSAAVASSIPAGGVTVGVFGGAHFRLDTWDLHESLTIIDDAAHAAPTGGISIGVQPLWFMAIKASVGVTPYASQREQNVAMRYSGDLNFYLLQDDWQPVVTIGGGAYHNIAGDHGSDLDAEGHWGVGVRGALVDRLTIEIGVRHIITDTYDFSAPFANNIEVFIALDGFVTTWGEEMPEPVVEAPPEVLELDFDGDGVEDADDLCREVQGPVNLQGCPPKPKAIKPVVVESKPPVVKKEEPVVAAFKGALHGIRFGTLSVSIRDSSTPILQEVLAAFRNHPNLTARIVGHTDNLASHTFNLWLSKKRARKVKAYLVSRGIDEQRIQTDGRGEYEPIASNKKRKGRAMNRRTEMVILTR